MAAVVHQQLAVLLLVEVIGPEAVVEVVDLQQE
jgi:hypothetical protein